MPNWNLEYYKSLVERFQQISEGLDARLSNVIDGRVAPSVDDMVIGSARKMRGAVIFFDIRSFSSRTGSPELTEMKKALEMIDCVIPMVMHVVYDFGGYIEKNTGDGVMAVVGVEDSDSEATNNALSIATTVFCVIRNIVNPYLLQVGIPPIQARIGIDLGTLLLARVGTPQGSAKQPRSFLTAISPAANLACRLQEMSNTDEIWVGDLIKTNAATNRQDLFVDVTPEGWGWRYKHDANLIYRIWHFNAFRQAPSI